MRPGCVNRNSINFGLAQLITTRQVKAARALLAWSQSDLAEKSKVSEPTIARLESVDGELGGRQDTIEKIRAALETAGITFLQPSDGGPGVQLKNKKRKK